MLEPRALQLGLVDLSFRDLLFNLLVRCVILTCGQTTSDTSTAVLHVALALEVPLNLAVGLQIRVTTLLLVVLRRLI